MIEGERLTAVELQSAWQAKAGPGCELLVRTDGDHALFVIRTGIASKEAELAAWEDRVGSTVASTRTIPAWPLGDGGRQITLDITLEDGFRFEGDLIEAPVRQEDAELETEWVFEGTPGVEMGERR